MSLRARNREKRNQEILDVAERLLMERGFTAVRFEDIATEAFISKPTLYAHFASKDDLMAGLAVRYLGRVSDYLRSPKNLPAAQRVWDFIHWVADFRFGSNASFIYSLGQQLLPSRHPNSVLHQAETEILDLLSGLIEEGQQEGGVRNDIEASCLAGILLGSNEGYLDTLLAKGRITVEQITSAWIALLTPPTNA